MINVSTGEKVIDWLTDANRLAEHNPNVAATLDALAETRNIAEELIYQGSFYKEFKDAWKLGAALADLPSEVFIALVNLHPDWFLSPGGMKQFNKWLNKPNHRAYRRYPHKPKGSKYH